VVGVRGAGSTAKSHMNFFAFFNFDLNFFNAFVSQMALSY